MVVGVTAKSNALEFTPLEFETLASHKFLPCCFVLEFTPLEFETIEKRLDVEQQEN